MLLAGERLALGGRHLVPTAHHAFKPFSHIFGVGSEFTDCFCLEFQDLLRIVICRTLSLLGFFS